MTTLTPNQVAVNRRKRATREHAVADRLNLRTVAEVRQVVHTSESGRKS